MFQMIAENNIYVGWKSTVDNFFPDRQPWIKDQKTLNQGTSKQKNKPQRNKHTDKRTNAQTNTILEENVLDFVIFNKFKSK